MNRKFAVLLNLILLIWTPTGCRTKIVPHDPEPSTANTVNHITQKIPLDTHPSTLESIVRSAATSFTDNTHVGLSSDLQFEHQAFSSARLIFLGETTHGDGKTIAVNARLIRYLHERLGVNDIVFEGGIYSCRSMWNAIKAGSSATKAAKKCLFDVWLCSREFQEVLDYIEAESRGPNQLRVWGLDPQLSGDISADEILSAFSKDFGTKKLPQNTKNQLVRILDREAEKSQIDHNMDVALIRMMKDVVQNSKSEEKEYWSRVLDSLAYLVEDHWLYKTSSHWAWLGGGLRDWQMAKNLNWLVSRAYPQRKFIVWTASGHSARDAGKVTDEQGRPPWEWIGAKLGDYVARWPNITSVVVGYTSYDGQIGKPLDQKTQILDPAPVGTLEAAFAAAGYEGALIDLRDHPLPPGTLARPFGYKFTRATWSDHFDLMVFIKNMTRRHKTKECAARR